MPISKTDAEFGRRLSKNLQVVNDVGSEIGGMTVVERLCEKEKKRGAKPRFSVDFPRF